MFVIETSDTYFKKFHSVTQNFSFIILHIYPISKRWSHFMPTSKDSRKTNFSAFCQHS